MENVGRVISRHGLEQHALKGLRTAYWNLDTAALYEETLRRGEGQLAEGGALVVLTGKHTGRSPKDKFIVREAETEGDIWWGDVNVAIDEAGFERLERKLVDYLRDRDIFKGEYYVLDVYAGADPDFRLPVRVVSESAWHSLFARNMFIQPTTEERADFEPQFTVLHAPFCHADPAVDGTNSESFIVVSFARRTVLVGGTVYAGEIKKSIFSILNYLLPERGVLPMHCQHRPGGRHGDLLRALGHRQDDTLGRCQSQPDRRRRARLVGPRRVQLRGRLLRQGHPPRPAGRA